MSTQTSTTTSTCGSDSKPSDELAHYLKLAFIGLLVFVFGLTASAFTESLSLKADAWHSLGDSSESIISALVCFLVMYTASADSGNKIRVIGAKVSAILLACVASSIIFIEAPERFANPREIDTLWTLVSAGVGLVANGYMIMLHHAVHEDHKNVTHSLQSAHLISDALTSVAVIVSATAMWITGIQAIDPFLSLAIGGVILNISLRRLFGIGCGHVHSHTCGGHGHNHHH